MRSNLIWLVIVSVAAVAVGEHVVHNQELTELHREIAAGRATTAGAPRSPPVPMIAMHPVPGLAMQSQAPVQPPTEDQATAPRNPEDDSHSGSHWKEEALAQRTAIEAGFAGEAVDGTWAAAARRDLRDKVSALLPSTSSLADVDCRASMCRVELVHREAAGSQRFMQAAFFDPKDRVWSGPGFAIPAETGSDGTVTVVLYLARDGASFPMPDTR